MAAFFRNTLYFSILYSIIVFIDLFIKMYSEIPIYRYISKPFIILSLLIFYLYNKNETSKKNQYLVLSALGFFLLGDLFLIEPKNVALFGIGMVCFIIGKLLYATRFSHQRDFKITRLLPFLGICFVYIFVIMVFIYGQLNDLLIPVLVYLFASVILLQLAYLRKEDVDKLSYKLIFIGVLISMISDGVTAVKTFYLEDFFFEKITILLFYSVFQYLVILGITKEVKAPETEII